MHPELDERTLDIVHSLIGSVWIGLDRFSPGLSARFNIESILALVVENTISDRRTVPVTCHCNLSLTTGSEEQSKNA